MALTTFGERQRVHMQSFVLPAGLVISTIMSACSKSTADPSTSTQPLTPFTIAGKYTMTASSQVVREATARLVYTVAVMNQSGSPTTIDYGACWAFLRVSLSADVTAKPIYDVGEHTTDCVLKTTRVLIAAGATGSLTGSFAIPTLLASGVAPGRYFISLRLAPNDSVRTLSAGQVDIQP